MNVTRSVSSPPVAASSGRPRWTAPTRGEWAQALDVKKSDPITMYVHGSLDQIQTRFEKAGWTKPMENTTASKLEYAGASVFQETLGRLWEPKAVKQAVAAMPIAHLTFNGKPDVLSFERNNDPLGGRDHFRIFDTGKVDAQGRNVYAVAASLDNGVHFSPSSPQQWFITHSVDPNADKERDNVMSTLGKSGGIASQTSFKLPFGASAPSGLNTPSGRVFDVVVR
jgi:hypothetical protein